MDLPENWEQNDNASWFNQWLVFLAWTDFQGSRVSGAFKVPKRIDAIKKLRKEGNFFVPAA